MKNDICIVVPVKNDEDCIEPLVLEVDKYLKPNYHIYFVCDPCTDGTQEAIKRLAAQYPVSGYFTEERKGQEPCTLFGLEQYKNHRMIGIMDVDLQDPPSLIPEMMRDIDSGYDLVWPYKSKTPGRGFMYRFFAWIWYGWMLFKRVPIPRGAGNFSVMTPEFAKKVIDSGIPFVRKAIASIPCRRKMIPYERAWRVAGESKYNRYWGSLKIVFMGLFE